MDSFRWPLSRRYLAVLGVLVLVVSAGCAGLGADDGGTEPDTANTTDPSDGTDSNSTDGTDGSDGSSPFGQLDPVESDLTGDEVLSQTTDALGEVDGYTVTEAGTFVAEQNNQQLTVQINRTIRVDRSAERLTVAATTETQGRTAETEQYLQNGTFYQRSAQIARQYGTEWLRTNVSDSFDQQFRQLDQIARLRQLLENSSATLEGRTELDGREVYAVNATVDPATATDVRPTVVETERVELSLWISTDTSLPLRIVEDSAFTESSIQGNLPQEADRSYRYDYGSVDITLPDAAKDAPFSGNVTQ
ncbi:LppX_LprAFG lipoprotein [Halovenus sp. WSH3]|uniref:LppX_LprAFG lipoprotein n=1 Tax=Halovenus carboxidivorans TaxID=2692199 RepID=A0A6B0T500_9EURY|nr:LppX_LprAFG lipoprotein [Halovenus carboxidivorans]MXR51256.1 LppX_LprAFG lipoprotein [Halovenus carboxidivorans]